MAGEKIGYVYSAYAGADHTGKEGCGVVISGGADGLPTVSIATAGVKIDGVILRGEVKDATDRVAKEGIVMMVVGTAIGAAGEVEIDGNGAIITKTTGVAIGKVFAAADAGDIVPVFLY